MSNLFGEQYEEWYYVLLSSGMAELSNYGRNIEDVKPKSVSFREGTKNVGEEFCGNDLSYEAASLICKELIIEKGADTIFSVMNGESDFTNEYGMTEKEYIKKIVDNKMYEMILFREKGGADE